MMVEGSLVALVSAESVEYVNDHAVHLVRLDGVPQPIHCWPVEVLAALDLAVDVGLADLPVEAGGMLAIESFLLGQARAVLLAGAGHAAVDGGAHGGTPSGMLLMADGYLRLSGRVATSRDPCS